MQRAHDRNAAAAKLPIFVLLLSATLSTIGCAAPSGGGSAAVGDDPAAALDALVSGDVRLYDLSHPLSPESIYWPSGSPFVHEQLEWGLNEDGDWYAAAAFSSPEHLGTHLDAPIHFAEGGWTNAEIPIEQFVAPGVVIDMSEKARDDPDATLAPADIDAWEGRNGAVPAAAIVVVRTGWSSRWPDWNAYYGSETPMDVGTLHFPGISAEGARALLARGIAGVAIDTASIDPGTSAVFEAHRVLAPANIFNLENLANVGELPETGFVVVALPMKIEGGTGGPTRVLALVPR